jgi:putative copper resistance protein D
LRGTGTELRAIIHSQLNDVTGTDAVNQFLHILPTWLELLSLAFCMGTLVCRRWVLPPLVVSGLSDERDFSGRLWLAFTISVAAMMTGSAIGLLGRSMEMSGVPWNAIASVLPKVIFSTHFGHVWLIRIMALFLWLILLKTGGLCRDSRWFLFQMLAVGLVVSMTESAAGHAADDGDFSIREIMDSLHLIAASAWGGGLFVLSCVILPKIARSHKFAAPLIAGVAGRFSRIAGFSIGILIITAVYNGIVNVGSVEALLLAPYGRIIAVKTYLFLLLICLGAFNRYVSVPLLWEQAGTSVTRPGTADRIAVRFFSLMLHDLKERQAALRFKRIVRVEAFLITGVLLCAAMLRHEIPARHFFHLHHAPASGGHEQFHHAAGKEAIEFLEKHPANVIARIAVDMTVHIKD